MFPLNRNKMQIEGKMSADDAWGRFIQIILGLCNMKIYNCWSLQNNIEILKALVELNFKRIESSNKVNVNVYIYKLL